MATTTHKSHSHVARPADFDGTDFTTFMCSVNLYIIGNAKAFPEDQDKIIFTLSYMKHGHAGAWAGNFTDRAIDGSDWGKWDKFKASLTKSFADPNLTKHAVEKLETMKQGRQSADEFFQTFETYRRQAGYTDDKAHSAYLIRLLEKAMNEELVNRVHTAENPVVTYERFKDRAIAQDGVMRHLAEVHKTSRQPASPHPRAHYTSPPVHPQLQADRHAGSGITFGGAGQAMDLDKVLAEHRCYSCGMKGHMKRDCPSRAKEQVRQIVGGMTEESRWIWLEQLGLASGQLSRESSTSPLGFQQAQE